MSGFEVRKKDSARIFFEGKEMCRDYFKTDKITFGTSYLLPGIEGEVDPGHPEGQEVFFVATGSIILTDTHGTYVELNAGDAVLVKEGTPHKMTNVSNQPALVVWALAPH